MRSPLTFATIVAAISDQRFSCPGSANKDHRAANRGLVRPRLRNTTLHGVADEELDVRVVLGIGVLRLRQRERPAQSLQAHLLSLFARLPQDAQSRPVIPQTDTAHIMRGKKLTPIALSVVLYLFSTLTIDMNQLQTMSKDSNLHNGKIRISQELLPVRSFVFGRFSGDQAPIYIGVRLFEREDPAPVGLDRMYKTAVVVRQETHRLSSGRRQRPGSRPSS